MVYHLPAQENHFRKMVDCPTIFQHPISWGLPLSTFQFLPFSSYLLYLLSWLRRQYGYKTGRSARPSLHTEGFRFPTSRRISAHFHLHFASCPIDEGRLAESPLTSYMSVVSLARGSAFLISMARTQMEAARQISPPPDGVTRHDSTYIV